MTSKKIIKETAQVDEAQPMGIFSRMGNKLATKVGGIAPNFAAQATGKLQTGTLANQVMTQYKQFLGQIGEKPSKENVIEFLTSKGYPTTKAQAALAALPEPTPAPVAPAANGTPPAAGGTATGLAGAVSEGQVHTVDLMRSYLSILREDTSITDADAAKIIMAAAQEHARTQAIPKAAPAAQAAPAAAAQAAPAAPPAATPSSTASSPAVHKIVSAFTLLSPADKQDALAKLQSATSGYQAESRRK